MATSGLNYLISVQLDKLGELQKLHDTIVAIQQLSGKGAEFDVRVNATSLESLSKEIGQAVSKGFSRGGGRVNYAVGGDGGGGGGGGSVQVDTTALEQSISKLAQMVSGMGGGGSRPVPTRFDRQIRNIDTVNKLLDELDKGAKVITDKHVRALRSALGSGFEGDDPFDLTKGDLRQRLADRRRRLVEQSQVVRETTASGRTPGLAIDASVINKAFETGAARLADALRSGIADATAGMATAISEAVRNGLAMGGGGQQYYGEVSPGEAKWGADVFRKTAYGTDPEQLRRSRQSQTESLDRVRADMRTAEDQLRTYETKLANLEAKAKAGQQFRGQEGLVQAIAERRKKLDDLRGEAMVMEQHIQQMDAEMLRTSPAGGPNFMSSRQRAQAEAVFEQAPQSHEALAQRRAAQFLSGLSTREGSMFQRAADAGVMAIPQVFERMSARVAFSPQGKALDEQIDQLRQQRAIYGKSLRSETDPTKRQEIQNQAWENQKKLEQAELERGQLTFRNTNNWVMQAATQLRAKLEMDRERTINNPNLSQ